LSQKEIQIIESTTELKKFLIELIKKDIKRFKIIRGSALVGYDIIRTSEILEKLGVKIFICRFCDVKYPEGLMWQIEGKPICPHCKEKIKQDDEELKYR